MIEGLLERVMSAIVANSGEPVVAAREAIAAYEAALAEAGYVIVPKETP